MARHAHPDTHRTPIRLNRPTSSARQAHTARLRHLTLIAALVAVGATTMSTPAQSQATTTTPQKTGHELVNGVSYYYEISGRGEPILLLHGGLGSTAMFQPMLPGLSDRRTVIAVDLQGHGRSSLGDRPIRLTDIADDMHALLTKLGFETVDVIGYSLGGGIAFRLAVQHPERVRRLAIISAGFAQDGFYPEMLPQQAAVGAAMADMMKETPMYKTYVAVAPHPEDFPKLLDRMGEYMRQPYNWRDDVKKVTAHTLLVAGDADMFRLEHIVEFYKLLGGGQQDAGWQREHMSKNRLAILPGVTHYEMFMAPSMAATVIPFINGEGAPVPQGKQ
ncbi:MAG: alpha/beta hydrolase [Gemmatimonadaceae bacterium]